LPGYRILSIDGGGLRGLIAARMLQRLNQMPEISGWLDSADLIAGTSTGGILALGIAAGKSPEEICQLYIEKGPAIFDDSIWDDIRDFGKLIGADYSNKTLKKELKSLFNKTKLSDLRCKVAIPAFDLDNEAPSALERTWKPKIFHNYAGDDSDGNQFVKDIALYTSSAPTYFPSANGFIDGGVFANNPSMVALAQAVSSRNIPSERADIEDIVLLSVGTGVNLSYIKRKNVDWGYAQWAKPLVDIMMEGGMGISDYQVNQLIGDRYHRLQVIFEPDETIPMDSVKKIPRMDEIGRNHDISSAKEWIEQYWMG